MLIVECKLILWNQCLDQAQALTGIQINHLMTNDDKVKLTEVALAFFYL